jgi:hypothetical protein
MLHYPLLPCQGDDRSSCQESDRATIRIFMCSGNYATALRWVTVKAKAMDCHKFNLAPALGDSGLDATGTSLRRLNNRVICKLKKFLPRDPKPYE